MSCTISRFLTRRQLSTLERIGNTLIPNHCRLPKFSDNGSLFQIDAILESSQESDLQSLKAVLTILSFLPDTAMKQVFRLMEKSGQYPGWLFAQMRLLNIGLRGVIFSLYYSGMNTPYTENSVHKLIGYQVHCRPDHCDLPD